MDEWMEEDDDSHDGLLLLLPLLSTPTNANATTAVTYHVGVCSSRPQQVHVFRPFAKLGLCDGKCLRDPHPESDEADVGSWSPLILPPGEDHGALSHLEAVQVTRASPIGVDLERYVELSWPRCGHRVALRLVFRNIHLHDVSEINPATERGHGFLIPWARKGQSVNREGPFILDSTLGSRRLRALYERHLLDQRRRLRVRPHSR